MLLPGNSERRRLHGTHLAKLNASQHAAQVVSVAEDVGARASYLDQQK
jgi:hypothetical protein